MSTLLAPPPDLTASFEPATRRAFLALLGAAGLLAGCGTPGGHTDQAPITRVADTPRGPVEIPADPQRVVAVNNHCLANALALGLPVVAGPGATGSATAPFPQYLIDAFPEQTAGILRTGWTPEIDYELIAAQNPDVILAGMFGTFDDGRYERFEAIAPTVTYRYSEGEDYALNPWYDVLRLNGTQFGRDRAAQDWITRFGERAAGLRDRVQQRWAGATWAVIGVSDPNIYVFGPRSGHIPTALTDELGLGPAPGVQALIAESGTGDQGSASLSPERLSAIDADIVFTPVYGFAGGGGAATVLADQPLWASLPAVRAGQVHEFTGDITNESGPDAVAFLDVVERALLA